jgi:3-oxoacyl-[acyl-carrier protein] reductase
MRLANKVAIITGAGSGFGKASAILFAKEGAKVVVVDINDDNGKKTVADITSSGGEAIFVHTDVSKASDVENLIKTTKNKFGKIDVIFNNAGIPQTPTPVEKLDEAIWDRIISINTKSIFLAAKYAFPIMKQDGGGVMINLASIASLRPRPGSAAYAPSKAAAVMLTKSLALEGAPTIRVNAINPVAADTPMLPGLLPKGVNMEEAKKALISTIPLGRLATPDDIAYAALFLASEESSMVTGSCIYVDGGRGI